VVTKCHLCADRLAEGQLPACVQACPTSAIRVEKVDVNEWRRGVAAGTAPSEAPGLPPAAITGSTTRFTVPEGIPASFGRERPSALRAEEPHWPLVILLVLSQWSLGLFAAALLLDLAAVTAPVVGFGRFELAPGAAAAGLGFLVGQAALAAGVFHLGRPAFALRAMRAWRHSWLSREAILFAAFGFAGAAAAAARCLDGLEAGAVSLSLTALALAAGGAGVFASVKIYLLPARPSWNSWRTPVLFFGTAVRLGATTALLLVAALPERSSPALTWGLAHVACLSALFFAFLPWCAAARALAGEARPERAAALLLTRRFAAPLWSRTVILLVAAALAPAAVASYPHPAALFLAACGQVLGPISEIAGRYLFFVTGVPLEVPGHFFESRSGVGAAAAP
jgi:DMSO reductase anchor subunit